MKILRNKTAAARRLCALLFLVFVGSALAEPKGGVALDDAEVFAPPGGLSQTREDRGALYTHTYRVPPTFLTGADGKLNLREPKSVLESAGVTFGPGSCAVYEPVRSALIVRNTLDQLELVEAYIDTGCNLGTEKEVTVIVEFIEVDARTLSDWIFESRLDTDGTPLRNMLQNLVREGSARVIETSVILCRSGQRAKTESVSEITYSSEVEHSDLPASVSVSGGSEVEAGGVTVTATECRKVGISTEADAVIVADEVTIDLSLAPGLIVEGGRSVWPNAEVTANSRQQMPGFYRSQINTQVTLKDGRYALLGTAEPRTPGLDDVDATVLAIFVRGDISRLYK